jgi:type IV secretion system protein VirB4
MYTPLQSATAARSSRLRREALASALLPYTVQLTEHVLRTRSLDYLQVFRLGGTSFESIDDEQLNNWHERLNVLWRNIAAPGVALWTHVIRHREAVPVAADSARGFADALHAAYCRRLSHETLMVNELFLSVVHRPAAGLDGLASRALGRMRPGTLQVQTSDALEYCDKLAQTIQASLGRYEPQLLGCYRIGAVWYSAVLEFLALLVNNEWQRMPLPRAPVSELLATTRLFFGAEAIEYRLPTGTRVGAMLGIKEYPTPTVVGMYNRLLSAPFAFVLTQSFAFLSKAAGQGLLQRQAHRMANAGDFGISQAGRLTAALDELTGNEFVMGDHHFSLQVLADLPEEPADAVPGGAAQRLKPLNDRVALARSLLADTGMTVAREDLALEAAFWAQLPANAALRPRKAPITSRNFAAMAAFHNYPGGRASGNHWGDALATFMTSASSPYHFSLHATDPADPDGGSRKDTGHTFICGPTGSGKSVLIGFLTAMLTRCGATQIVFDKDRGLEILVRALGGEYLPLRSGEPTGFNPLQLPGTPTDVEFLKGWLQALVCRGSAAPLRVREQADLEQALHGTLALEHDSRRLSRLIEFLDPTDPEGLHARLAPWCACMRGDYAWVFDNARDSLLPRLPQRPLLGFDVTEFLDHAVTRTPVTLYLFHLVRSLLDGRRLVCWMDEFWRLLGDPAFESFAKDAPKTWRKLNGVMCVATQSAGDVLDSPISRTIVEQTATKVFFPNPEASLEEYTAGFGLTEREFRLVKERLEPGSRMFLVKQGHHSIVCQLDLKGFDAELSVISGRAGALARMQALVQRYGPEPRCWLPPFLHGDGGAGGRDAR